MQNAAFVGQEPAGHRALLIYFRSFFFSAASFAASCDLDTHNNKCSWWEELVKSWGVTIVSLHETRSNNRTVKS